MVSNLHVKWNCTQLHRNRSAFLFKAVCKSACLTLYRWSGLFSLSCSIALTSNLSSNTRLRPNLISALSSRRIISAWESVMTSTLTLKGGDYVSQTAFWFSWAIKLWKFTCIHMFTPGSCLFQGNIWQGADVKMILLWLGCLLQREHYIIRKSSFCSPRRQ